MWWITLGTGTIRMSATSSSRTYSPEGVSIWRFATSARLSRVSGVLQNWTS